MFNKTAIHVVCDIELNPNEASFCDHFLVRVLTMIEHVRTRKNNDDTYNIYVWVKKFPLENNHIVCLNQYTHLTHLKINIFIKCLTKKFETGQSVFYTFEDDQNNIPGSLDHAYAVAYFSSISVRIIREVSSRRSQTRRRWYELMS